MSRLGRRRGALPFAQGSNVGEPERLKYRCNRNESSPTGETERSPVACPSTSTRVVPGGFCVPGQPVDPVGGPTRANVGTHLILPQELLELYQDAGFTRHEAACFLGRSDRQFRRWMILGAPLWVGRMLRLRAGWLDEYGWLGWRIRDGRLWCLDWNEWVEPGDLFAWWWLRQKWFSYDGPEVMTSRNGEVGL